MLRNMQRRAPSTRLIAGTPFVGPLASQIIADTAAGDYGPGLLYDEALANPGQRLRLVVTSPPAAGDLFVFEDGSILFSGAPAAVYTVGYTPYVFNTALPGDTATINYGTVDASAAGATLFAASTLTAGTAAGEINATAAGTTLTGTATLAAGAATGEQSATASGITLEAQAIIIPGPAFGAGSAVAPGVSLIGAGVLLAGAASGQASATTPGITLSALASMLAGSASGGTDYQDATASGVVLSSSAILIPGAAFDPQFMSASSAWTITAAPRAFATGSARNFRTTGTRQ